MYILSIKATTKNQKKFARLEIPLASGMKKPGNGSWVLKRYYKEQELLQEKGVVTSGATEVEYCGIHISVSA